MSEMEPGYLQRLGIPAASGAPIATSAKRFPDGAQFRIEIPSTEGPAALDAVLEAAAALNVTVHRVSQGSGVCMLTDQELDQMASSAADARVEVSLFARPNAAWGTSALARSPAGAAHAAAAHGADQLRAVLDDVRRAAAHGFRSVLLADVGALYAFGRMRADGELPADMQAKISVMLPVSNPLTALVMVQLGASTLNVPTDISLPDLAAIRQVVDVPIDMYVEAPDGLGGFVRMHELAEMIRVAAPLYAKFGLRNAPDVYPSGGHLEATVRALSRERVRRARLALDLLDRQGKTYATSSLGAEGLAVPRAVKLGPVSPATERPPAGR
jgi:hypothetical protein